MSLSSQYFPEISPAVYDVFRNSSNWHKQNVPAYDRLSENVKRKIEGGVSRLYSEIVEAMVEDDDTPTS